MHTVGYTRILLQSISGLVLDITIIRPIWVLLLLLLLYHWTFFMSFRVKDSKDLGVCSHANMFVSILVLFGFQYFAHTQAMIVYYLLFFN